MTISPPLPAGKMREWIPVLADVADANTVRVAANPHTVAVSATPATRDVRVTVERACETPVRRRHTIDTTLDAVRSGKLALAADGWDRESTPSSTARFRALRRHGKFLQRATTRITIRQVAAIVAAYHQAPGESTTIIGIGDDAVTIAAAGPHLRAAVHLGRNRQEWGWGEASAIAIPTHVIHQALRPLATLQGAITATWSTTDNGISRLTLSGHHVSVHLDVDGPCDASIPQPPHQLRRRHDLHIPSIGRWKEFLTAMPAPSKGAIPVTFLRLAGDRSGDQKLTVDLRLNNLARHTEMPCSTSDDFALDVPWQTLIAALRPALAIDATSLTLRYFDPNPALTPLVITFHRPQVHGFCAIGARRPAPA